jgi:hypothetical protein
MWTDPPGIAFIGLGRRPSLWNQGDVKAGDLIARGVRLARGGNTAAGA